MSKIPQLYQSGIRPLSVAMQKDWRTEMKLHTTEKYLDTMYEARKADQSCYFCGFKDSKYIEVHHLNHNHNDYSKDNLVACCTLCHRTHHIGWVGIKNHGQVAFIPNDVSMISEETSPSVAIFNQLQRFHMIREYYDEDTKRKLKNLSLYKSIDNLILNNKRIVISDNYNQYLYRAELKRIQESEGAGMSAEEKKANEKDSLTGDDAVRTETDLTDTSNSTITLGVDGSKESILNLASGSLLDIVVSLGDLDKEYKGDPKENPLKKFIDTQSSGKYGRFVILFNNTVFEPFEPYPEYDFYERIRHYLSLPYFNINEMGSVLEQRK